LIRIGLEGESRREGVKSIMTAVGGAAEGKKWGCIVAHDIHVTPSVSAMGGPSRVKKEAGKRGEGKYWKTKRGLGVLHKICFR